jgi:hypothetical protein
MMRCNNCGRRVAARDSRGQFLSSATALMRDERLSERFSAFVSTAGGDTPPLQSLRLKKPPKI